MKTLKFLMVGAVGIVSMMLMTCGGDLTKPAGPGGLRMQPYDGSNGQYK